MFSRFGIRRKCSFVFDCTSIFRSGSKIMMIHTFDSVSWAHFQNLLRIIIIIIIIFITMMSISIFVFVSFFSYHMQPHIYSTTTFPSFVLSHRWARYSKKKKKRWKTRTFASHACTVTLAVMNFFFFPLFSPLCLWKQNKKKSKKPEKMRPETHKTRSAHLHTFLTPTTDLHTIRFDFSFLLLVESDLAHLLCFWMFSRRRMGMLSTMQ